MKNNKFFKKFAATFLAAAILLASAPLSGFAGLDLFNISASAYFRASGTCGDAVSWEVNFETDVMIVSGNGTMLNYSDSSRSPWYNYSGDIEIVTIEEGVTNIGDYAFNNCSYLGKITIPESVTSIGDYAFAGCDDLTDVYFPGTQEQWNSIQINSNNDLLLNATIHYNEVNTVFDGTFAGLDWSVNTSTGELIINGNGTIIEGVSNFRAPWFTYSGYIKKLTIGEGIVEIKSSAFRMLSKLTSVTFPKSLCAIGSGAFSYCSSLTSINFPEKLQSIGDYAFERCSNLTVVKIPKSVTSIGSYAFDHCDSLEDVFYVGTAEEWNKIDIGYANDKILKTNIYFIDSVDSTDKTKGLCGDNVSWCWVAETGELLIKGTGKMSYYSSRKFPWYQFNSLIEHITIEDGVTNISDWAFMNCNNLKSVKMADSVTNIDYMAFYNCTSLTSVTIPCSVTSIENDAFAYCDKINDVYYEGSVADWCAIKFQNRYSNPAYYCENFYFNETLAEGNLIIPYGVTSISAYAFYSFDSFTSITIPDSVTSIGDYAFCWCDSLKSVIIPDGVTSIGDHAFADCMGLTSITIPDSVTSIGNDVFDYTSRMLMIYYPGTQQQWDNISLGADNYDWLNQVILECDSEMPHTLKLNCGRSVYWTYYLNGELVFSGSGKMDDYYSDAPWTIYVSSVNKVTIGSEITHIGEDAFGDCTSITSITIPDSVKSIGGSAFSGCSGLESIIIPDSVTSIGGSAFRDCSGLESIIIPDSVTSIGGSAFSGCTRLTSITLPEGVKSIGSYAFKECDSLTSIIIPDSVTEISSSAFYKCNNLANVTFGKGLTQIDNDAFYDCYSLTSIEIPDSVTTIGKHAFYGCRSLANIILPDSITSIDYTAFQSTAFYNNDSNWAGEAFYIGNHLVKVDNSNISCLDIKDGTKFIHDGAFESCRIGKIIIPASVIKCYTTSFGKNTLRCITVDENNPVYSSDEYGVLYNKDKTEVLKCPPSCPETEYVIPDSVTVIGKAAFNSCSQLTRVDLPDSVTNIGDHAFANCTSLTSIIIPDSVTSIGGSAFSGCSGLESITIPDSVTSIGESVFYGCDSLTSITIPDSVTSIGESVFYGCDSLTSITIPDSVTSIGDSAFYNTGYYNDSSNWEDDVLYIGCYLICANTSISGAYTIKEGTMCIADFAFYRLKNLTSTTIPNGVVSVGERAFYDCTSLTSITIPDSVTSLGECTFASCTSLAGITIPDSVTSIGESVFYGCDSLTSITIPDSVTSIDSYAFRGCRNLTSITIPDSVTSIGDSAFCWCDSLKSVIIPDGVTSIGNDAFQNCTNLENITIPGSVTSIGSSVFYKCESLADVYYNGTEEEWNNVTICSNNSDLFNATIHFAEHEHSYESEITTQPTCTAEGVETFVCECGDSYTKAIPEKGHTLSHITVESTCKVAGMEYDLCSECEGVFNSNKLALKDHTWGEWTVTAEPTTENEGSKTRTCSVCSKEETVSIPKLEVIVNEETGIEIVFGEEYGDGVEVQASEVYDGSSFQLVETNYGNVKTTIFDISTTIDGVAVQPSGKVKVRIPLPEGFEAGKIVVCYVDSENGKVTSIPAKVVDGYVEFETDHFSHYALLATKGKVHSVKIDDVSLYYKDTMFIFPKVYADDGVKYTVTYSSSKPSVAEVNRNGQITAKSFGRTTITCTVTDENGNTVTESFKVNVKYTFLQWIIKLFLFGDLWYY